MRKALVDQPDFLTELAKAIGGIDISGKPGPYPADPDTTLPLPKVSQSDGVVVYLVMSVSPMKTPRLFTPCLRLG